MILTPTTTDRQTSRHTLRQIFLLCILCVSICGLSSCSSRPNKPIIPRERALMLDSVMEMKIVHVFDGLIHSRDPHVTHLIEVRILSGPEAVLGAQITLPYDSYNTGATPPRAGSTVTLAPSNWVKRNGSSFGRGSARR